MKDPKVIVEEMNKVLKQLNDADGFYVMITKRNGKKLNHWDGYINMSNEDIEGSLREVSKSNGIQDIPHIMQVKRKFS